MIDRRAHAGATPPPPASAGQLDLAIEGRADTARSPSERPVQSRAAASSAAVARRRAPPLVVVHTTRDRARALAAGRVSAPESAARAHARPPEELEATFRSALVDAAIVDLAAAREDTWRAAALAREFPSVPFFGLARAARGRSARAGAVRRAGVRRRLVESVDDAVVRVSSCSVTPSRRRFAARARRAARAAGAWTRRCSARPGAASWRGRDARCAPSCSPTPSVSRAST